MHLKLSIVTYRAWDTNMDMETEKLNHARSCFIIDISLIYFPLIWLAFLFNLNWPDLWFCVGTTHVWTLETDKRKEDQDSELFIFMNLSENSSSVSLLPKAISRDRQYTWFLIEKIVNSLSFGESYKMLRTCLKIWIYWRPSFHLESLECLASTPYRSKFVVLYSIPIHLLCFAHSVIWKFNKSSLFVFNPVAETLNQIRHKMDFSVTPPESSLQLREIL